MIPLRPELIEFIMYWCRQCDNISPNDLKEIRKALENHLYAQDKYDTGKFQHLDETLIGQSKRKELEREKGYD